MFATVVVIVIILHVQMILNKYIMVVDNVAVKVTGTGTSTDMEYGEIVTLRSTRTRRSTVLFFLPVRAVNEISFRTELGGQF